MNLATVQTQFKLTHASKRLSAKLWPEPKALNLIQKYITTVWKLEYILNMSVFLLHNRKVLWYYLSFLKAKFKLCLLY